jgi:hypothetical protein
MSATKKPPIAAQSKQQRTRYDRGALLRFHNSLYLGCVIGALTGLGYGHTLLCWPRRAWQGGSLRRTGWPSPMIVARPDA